MVFLKTWNDFKLLRSHNRKLIVYGADDDYKENLVDFFENKLMFFCNENVEDAKIIENKSHKFLTVSIEALNSLKKPLDIIIFSTVNQKKIASLIRIFNSFTSDLYLYVGKKDEALEFNENRFTYLSSLLLNNTIKNIYGEIKIPLHKYFNSIDQEQFLACRYAIVDYNQNICLKDYLGKYSNHLFGKRVTRYQPRYYNHKFHIFGDSRVYGVGVEDKFTFCSFLQKKLNNYNHKVKVINHGIPGFLFEGFINRISSINLTSADTVFLCISFYAACWFYRIDADTLIYLLIKIKNKCISYGVKFTYVNLPTVYDLNKKTELEKHYISKKSESLMANYLGTKMKENIFHILKSNSINIIDATKAFDQSRIYSEVFLDDHHFLNSGNKLIAQVIFDSIDENKSVNQNLNIVNKQNSKVNYNNINIKYKFLLEEKYESYFLNYLKTIEKHRYNTSEVIGSIVVNCNPFTNGHLKIIEYASLQVDFLYIFVVEEDSSYFSFKDRMFLVKENTKHIKNIVVNPSGQNIISKVTFPEYFSKGNIKDDIVDCSHDLLTFSSNIAPVLNISKRFIGSEPFCNVTRQYNERMKEILPMYNIDVVEIGRFSVDNEYISASKVRELFHSRDFYAIKKLVPEMTYNFLKAK